MKQLTLVIAFLIYLILNVSCAPVSQKHYEKKGQRPLTIEQIKENITERSLQLETIDVEITVVFHKNMTMTATNREGDTDSGKWSTLDNNLLCLVFNSWYFGDNRCYRIIEDANHLIFFSPNGALSYTGTIQEPKEGMTQSQPQGSIAPPFSGVKTQPMQNNSETDKERFIKLARNCPGCNFSGVDLSNAQLNHANLAGADLSGANLTNANLRQANLAGANLSSAKLIRTNLPGANLSSANLTNADLSGSNLIRANVTGTITTNINLTGAHLESIQGIIQ